MPCPKGRVGSSPTSATPPDSLIPPLPPLPEAPMRLRRILVGCLVLAVPLAGRADTPSVSKDVAPIFRSRCLECHAGAKGRGDLRLTSRAALLEGGANGPALKLGKSAESLLFTHLRDLKMPPKSTLDRAEIDRVRRWIDA